METLVDIEGFTEPRDYAFHIFHGSGVESYWSGFDHFHQEYLQIRRTLAEQLAENEEYDFPTMFKLICKANSNINGDTVNQIAERLFDNFWKNYTARCYVDNNVGEILSQLKKKYRMVVVSNFKVEDGIETLLKSNNIDKYFDFIINSTSIGWRKPDKRIYEAVFNKTKSIPQQHIFIGDDYENDFQQPLRMGMKALLFDRKNKYSNIRNRVDSLSDILTHI